nr:hypothetical protein [Tanacetum cinerariifolium]
MSSSSSDENKKMKSMIRDDDEIKATREKIMLDFHKDLEALCKVHREINVEFRDEANAADPYKVVVLVV